MCCSALKVYAVDGSSHAAERMFDRLFSAVFSRLCEPGQKVLDAENLATKLSCVSGGEEDLKAARRLLTRLNELEERVSTLEATVQDHGATIQTIVRERAEEVASAGQDFLPRSAFGGGRFSVLRMGFVCGGFA